MKSSIGGRACESIRAWRGAGPAHMEVSKEICHYGERISTGFVESAINTVVGKRFGKRQQMQWSKSGAHLMLQARTRTLDGTLRGKFEQWYPGLKAGDRSVEVEPRAA